uniref:CFA20 domain-containing protein n=1 Tax=Globisporangium ultimum (strain ATCC 200006 / CBS 805.95 / DAOM BR144) TaxID=431595 RepID=K3W9X7_GLOUD
MFAQVYQSGLISLLYSVGNKPLQLWEKQEETPARSVTRVLDDEIQSAVIELSAVESISKTWVRCPMGATSDSATIESGAANLEETFDRQASLHIRLQHLVLLVKPLDAKDMSIEVHVCDSRKQIRRFRASTFQKATVVHPLMTSVPLTLDAGCWNQLQLDLAKLTREAYGTTYEYTISVQLHANCRVRRVYFAEKVFPEEQLPVEFRLFKRLSKAQVAAYKELDKDAEARK